MVLLPCFPVGPCHQEIIRDTLSGTISEDHHSREILSRAYEEEVITPKKGQVKCDQTGFFPFNQLLLSIITCLHNCPFFVGGVELKHKNNFLWIVSKASCATKTLNKLRLGFVFINLSSSVGVSTVAQYSNSNYIVFELILCIQFLYFVFQRIREQKKREGGEPREGKTRRT